MNFLGLGKTLYNSSICLLKYEVKQIEAEILITERLTRKKYSGAWPKEALKSIKATPLNELCENSDVIKPSEKEEILNKTFPFYDSLDNQGLLNFTSKNNPNLSFISHHLAHAYAALSSSPFQECLIFVADGGGTQKEGSKEGSNEHHSLYHFKEGELTLIENDYQEHFESKALIGKKLSNGLGAFYESISEYIFNDNFSSGKVMGLAPFGKAEPIPRDQIFSFLENLDWSKRFSGEGKIDWEDSPHMENYIQLAATAQASLEAYFLSLLTKYKHLSQNLIFTGGVALNCTLNWKIQDSKLFKSLYIPHNPNDLGISLGCAFYKLFHSDEYSYSPTPKDKPNPFNGAFTSKPSAQDIPKLFSEYRVTKKEDISKAAAELLLNHEILAWFQGRSETGPRSLGHRSIIANIQTPGLKDLLNREIKFREDFRPYACSVIHEDVESYFQVPNDFSNPFMSYAVPIQDERKQLLKEVAHCDMTNRMQMVYPYKNERYYDLLIELKKLTGHGLVLNTSLNIMGEPIVETPQDLLKFFRASKIKKVIIGEYLIEK